ncbi:hypothetical protein PoB_004612000 [Plakobranchus ocellatus]|uniref:Uncharacterized protein n=1 Tax=Plakobranchus ocellatus TaxID=259542 RepID=A0AAV4BGE1_9GAST|nr:hypothetical protein PoB_004612000 [Plakobranchus ocellatus]
MNKQLRNLTARYHQKEIAIGSLEEEIKVLREDVLESRGYADQIQKQLEELQTAATSLESGAAYMEKDEHIRLLQNEVSKLHINLAEMEKELARAKEMIAQQGTKLRLVDVDRLNMQTKYKQDLANVTNMMRRDNEKMRDEMKRQWKQMRELREQNEDMRSDIREIRNLVLSDQPLPQHSPQLFDQTRGFEHVNSSHLDLQPLSSALPTLSPKGARKVYGSSRKKT